MAGFILAEKISQSQVFDESGKRIPTTFLKTSPCYLIDIRTPEKNGYFSVVLGSNQKRQMKKSVKGQLDKAGIKTPLRFLKEIRLEYIKDVSLIEEEDKKGLSFPQDIPAAPAPEVTPAEGEQPAETVEVVAPGKLKVFIGDLMNPTLLFKVGENVDVTGVSIGKGFQGVVKRHGFAGGPRTHGQSDRERAPGSVGQGTTPGHTYKGKKMAGRMGGERITVENLTVVSLQEDGMTVKGLVPGHDHTVLEVVSVKQ